MHKKYIIVFAPATFVFIFSSIFNFLIYQGKPHVHDEIAYLFQAKIFKSGAFFINSPPCKEFFDFPHIINNGRWYSMYPPGFPLILLFGLIFKAAWIINPLVGAIFIFILYLIGRELYEEKVGKLSALLGSLSIWHLLMSSTMLSHPASLLFTSLFLFYFIKSLKKKNNRPIIISAIFLGIALLIRPINALAFALPFFIFGIYFNNNFKKLIKNYFVFGLIFSIFLGILFFYNFITNGHPFRFGYLVYHGKEYAVIFGRPATLVYDYTPFVGFIQIGANISAINSYLFGWPLTSFWLVLPLFFHIIKDLQERKKTLFLISGFLGQLIFFYFFWGTFIFIGARMFYESILIFILISARGLDRVIYLIEARKKIFNIQARHLKIISILISLIFIVYSFFIKFPSWVWPKNNQWYYATYGENMAGATTRINNSIQKVVKRPALILMKFVYFPLPGFPTGWWSSGAMYNSPDLNGEIIYAMDRGEENKKIFECFSKRNVYLYIGTLEKGMLFKISLSKEGIFMGQPTIFNEKNKRYIELIDNPSDLFFKYSQEFSDFLCELFKRIKLYELDAELLFKSAVKAWEERDAKKAAFYAEASLQLEKNPYYREQILNFLAGCYFKLGYSDQAKRILDKIAESVNSVEALFNVLPEKGF